MCMQHFISNIENFLKLNVFFWPIDRRNEDNKELFILDALWKLNFYLIYTCLTIWQTIWT